MLPARPRCRIKSTRHRYEKKPVLTQMTELAGQILESCGDFKADYKTCICPLFSPFPLYEEEQEMKKELWHHISDVNNTTQIGSKGLTT
jgi:hypothetical protein